MLYLCDITLTQDHGEVVHILSSADATPMNHDGALPHDLTILVYFYHVTQQFQSLVHIYMMYQYKNELYYGRTLTDESSVLCNVYQYI